MTVREYFKARSKRTRILMGVGLLIVSVAVGAFAVTDRLYLYGIYRYEVTGAAVLGLSIMFGAMLYLDLTKCPQCLGRLGFQIANQYRFGSHVNYCPFCGVGFDKCEMRSP